MKDQLRKIILENEGDRDDIYSDVLAFVEEREKEASLDFAKWLANQVLNGRTITKLWSDYVNEVKQ